MSDSYQDMENSVIVEATSPEVPKSVKKRNKKLCKRFPFLIPTNEWSGKRITDCCGPDGEEGYWPGSPDHHPDYDWEYTKLDDMPEGWRKAFGEQMCEEIMQELVEHNCVDKYRVTQIKEKYGELRWCDFGGTDKIFREIIPKYEELSKRTCINCGAPATRISTGWISPWCDQCILPLRCTTVPIEEWFKEDADDEHEV